MRYGGVSVAKMCLYDVISSQWIMILIWNEQRAWRIKFEACAMWTLVSYPRETVFGF